MLFGMMEYWDVSALSCFLVQSLGQSGASEKARLLNAFAGAMLQRENIPTALRCVLEIEKVPAIPHVNRLIYTAGSQFLDGVPCSSWRGSS